MTQCSFRALVRKHFSARIRPDQEARLREHLPECASCTAYYERHLVLAELDPSVPSARQRLAVGLGLSLDDGLNTARRRTPVALMAAVAAAACLALVASVMREPALELQARGAATGTLHVWVYRVGAEGQPAQLDDEMAPTDELAFAVDSHTGGAHLLLFGVDEHRQVYWYHPAWLDRAAIPRAVPITRGRHELPEAIAHDLDGSELTLYAVLADSGTTVRDVERDLEAYVRQAAWHRRVRVAR